MTSRADVNRLSRGTDALVSQARADIAAFFYGWDVTDPADMRDALLEIVPSLVREYGDLAGTAAAEWYEELRTGAVGGPYNAVLADGASDAAVEGSVRWAAGELFGDNPSQVLELLNGAVQRHIMQVARETVRRNVGQDRSRPRFARVPALGEVCPFCDMLASRGFAYSTEQTAGEDDPYHDNCRCQIVPEWDAESAHIAGYDPDAMYDRYQEARAVWDAKNSRAPQANDLVPILRELYPELYPVT